MRKKLQHRIEKVSSRISRIESKLSTTASFRLFTFLSIPACALILYFYQIDLILSIFPFIGTILVFYVFVKRYNLQEDFKNRLVSYNDFLSREILRAEKKTKDLFRSIPVADSIRNNHPFCEDLNIFEKDGLFSLIDTTSTEQGEKLFLSNLLQSKSETYEEIINRQTTVKRFSNNIWFSYQFIRKASEDWEFFLGKKWETNGWKRSNSGFYSKRKILRKIFPILSIVGSTTIFASMIFQLPFGASFFILNTVIFLMYRRDSLKEFQFLESVTKRSNQTERLILQINRIDKKWKNEDIKKSFQTYRSAVSSVWSAPLAHFMMNAFFLHDLWKLRSIEKWTIEYSDSMKIWIERLEVIDSLMPFIHLHYTYPTWNFPTIDPKNRSISGLDLTHPLLQENSAVANPLNEISEGSVLLITGSNMSGKTTYMRTIGTNILLALCGGVVSAKTLTLPPLRILCSVKNQDSLTEGISLFYAEARRLAEIFKSIESNDSKYLILLDEILKGTNTKERFLASEFIIKRLQGSSAYTLCTTHDLDLAKLPNLTLKHFTEKIVDDAMSFDFQIRDGVVATTNAIFILRKEGVVQ
ncbi:MutS-related protein [Leptospira sp. GIMC2001]|uniref:MutS-related protein n=1 Tax=Leptospira sp. GIMC2001 TaxID=1513297 RepID=UPI00234ACF1E|nr:hypothetical protein [Leptospira sp. GIMC2001]WCL49900.1 hypothetical protein O4O04_03530 [Leptospira sp. GIMC2001]